MITKVCQYKARRDQGEKLVQVFQPGDIDGAAEFFGMFKTAAPMLPEVQKFLEGLRADPGKLYILVNALGAGEYWGSNINGDYFPEGSLIHEGPDYGYKTFYNAHPFKHHVNKDPDKSFGDVVLAVWHPHMKRVELIIAIDRARAERVAAQDVVDKLDAGQFPDVSMGCRVPYDLCSVCTDWPKYRRAQSTFDPRIHPTVGKAVLAYHKTDPIRGLSPTRHDYCEHLTQMLNKILQDGRKVYMINDYPRFFDLSFVFIGADKTAKVMAKLAAAHTGGSIYVVPSWKVAEMMGYEQPPTEKEFEKVAAWYQPQKVEKIVSTAYKIRKRKKKYKKSRVRQVAAPAKLAAIKGAAQKRASHSKGAEIIKDTVPSQFGGKAVPLENIEPDLPNEVLDQLGTSDLSKALSTPSSMGILLKPREFQRITIIRLGKKPLADDMDEKGQVFSPTAPIDRSVPMGTDQFSSSLKDLLMPFLSNRSCFDPVIKRRIVRITVCSKPTEGEVKTPDRVENDDLLNKVAAAYNGYLDQAIGCMLGADRVLEDNADLWEAVHGLSVGDEFEKVSAGINPSLVLGAAGGGYLLSRWAQYQKERAMQGARAPTGRLTQFLADHPMATTLAAGLGGLHLAGSKAPSALLKGLYGAAKGAVKSVR
jgi:hypothetical protein